MMTQVDAAGLLAGVDLLDAGSGPVVALAHGAGGGVRENFAPIIAESPDRRFVGPYYPGAGATPEPVSPLVIEELADQVVGAGVRAGAQRFPVLGLSLGAAVAVTAAVRHPEHVERLVLTVGLARPDAQARAFGTAWRALAAAGDLDALAALLVHAAGSAEDLAGLDEAGYRAAVAETRRTYPPGGVAHVELVLRTDVTALLPQITVPTLVVVGGQDRILLPGTVGELARIPGSIVVEYPCAGHVFGPAQAGRWARDVREFLTG